MYFLTAKVTGVFPVNMGAHTGHNSVEYWAFFLSLHISVVNTTPGILLVGEFWPDSCTKRWNDMKLKQINNSDFMICSDVPFWCHTQDIFRFNASLLSLSILTKCKGKGKPWWTERTCAPIRLKKMWFLYLCKRSSARVVLIESVSICITCPLNEVSLRCFWEHSFRFWWFSEAVWLF